MRSRARRLAIAVCGVITVTLMVLLGGALVNVHQLYGRQHALLVSQQAEVRMVTGDLKACTSDLKETNEKTAMTKEWLAVTSPGAVSLMALWRRWLIADGHPFHLCDRF